MNNNLDKIISNFVKISKIPRISHHEKKISTYIENWCKQRNIFCIRDQFNNLIIRKVAHVDSIVGEYICLHSHLDMVDSKTLESNHDFLNDPIEVINKNGFLMSNGETTLGADNGIGISYCLTLLESKDIKHGPLEIVFTTAEEDDFSGAKNIDLSLLNSKRMISLDNNNESSLLVSSAGGIGIKKTFDIIRRNKNENSTILEISLDGFKGGHSGLDIDKSRGNALISIIDVILQLPKCTGILDILLNGNRLSIPSQVKAIVEINDEIDLDETIKKILSNLRMENSNNNIILSYKILDNYELGVLTNESKDKLIMSILCSLNGIVELARNNSKGILASSNLGEIDINKDKLTLTSEFRSAENKYLNLMIRREEIITKLLGGCLNKFAGYSSWEYKEISPIRDAYIESYYKLYNEKLEIDQPHVGLEGAFFVNKINRLDLITIGPNIFYEHTPKEKASIDSIERVFNVLIDVLENN